MEHTLHSPGASPVQLYLTPNSPFARLVLATALECRLRSLQLCWVDPWITPAELIDVNPFSTIPALRTEGHAGIWESSLICAYLARQAPPAASAAKLGDPMPDLEELQLRAIGRTLMDVAVKKVVLERHRDAHPHPSDALARRADDAMVRALAGLEARLAPRQDAAAAVISMGELGLAVALEYLRFRHGALFDAHVTASTLRWLAPCSQRLSLLSTTPAALALKPAYGTLMKMTLI